MDVKEILARVSDELGMRRVFGEPIERDGTLIVPVALFAGGGGAGTDQGGRGPGETPEVDAEPAAQVEGEEPPGPDKGGQSGAGFGGYVRPLGVYEIKDGQARFVPAVHATAIAITAIVAAGVVGAIAVGRILGR